MTVTYADRGFLRLLFRWRGSIWKACYRPLIIFLVLYYIINLSYRFALNESQKESFERSVYFLGYWNSRIPIQFLLGFYVNYVVSRWWDQYNSISWPDKFLLFINSNITGNDEQTRLIRRTIARYANLLSVLVWREVSIKVKKRFPKDSYLVTSGLMTQEELNIYNNTTGMHGRWFVPVSWILNLLIKCKDEGRFGEVAMQTLMDQLYAFRVGFAMLTVYDWVNAPLVYTQVVTIATYGYFAFCLVGRQCLENNPGEVRQAGYEIDSYVPFGTILEFLFYMGWLKVGEMYRCPFGEDDDDFDMNYILDRNMVVSNMLVDELAQQNPPLVKDSYWSNKCPILPHTKASIKVRDRIPNWRLYKTKLTENDTEIIQGVLDGSKENGSQVVDLSNMEVTKKKPGEVDAYDSAVEPLIRQVNQGNNGQCSRD